MEFMIFLPLPIIRKTNIIGYILAINLVILYWSLEATQEPLVERPLESKLHASNLRARVEPGLLHQHVDVIQL